MKNGIPETMAEAIAYENARIAPSFEERVADPFAPHRFIPEAICYTESETSRTLVIKREEVIVKDNRVAGWILTLAKRYGEWAGGCQYYFPDDFELPEEITRELAL